MASGALAAPFRLLTVGRALGQLALGYQERRELERRSEQEQRNFETTMATIAAYIANGTTK
jgi:hypothetical protein